MTNIGLILPESLVREKNKVQLKRCFILFQVREKEHILLLGNVSEKGTIHSTRLYLNDRAELILYSINWLSPIRKPNCKKMDVRHF